MKNQYFGDTRDLFKYDLAEHLMNEVPGLKQFTFIPMLTADDHPTNGMQIDYQKSKAGFQNSPLVDHLRKCVTSGQRNISEIRSYFDRKGKALSLYREKELFLHQYRDHYFRGIYPCMLENALILLDPDNGLEVRDSDRKHLLYSDLSELHERMDENSILMVFQFIPRENHSEYIEKRCRQIHGVCGIVPGYLTDQQIIFYLVPSNASQVEPLNKSIGNYSKIYQSLKIGFAGESI